MSSTNLKPWAKGVSGNPGGKPALPENLRGITSLSQHEVTKLVSKYARMTMAELVAAVESPSIPMLELAIANIFVLSAQRGDFMRLAFLLDRAIGKVPNTEIQVDPVTPLANLSDEELLKLVRGQPKELDAG